MKKYSLIISTIILVLLFLKLSSNYSERFSKIEDSYGKSSANLSKGANEAEISSALMSLEGYDKADADFVARQMVQKFKKGAALSALSDLNKRVWQIPAAVIDSCGSANFKAAADSSKVWLGQDKEFLALKEAELQPSVAVESGQPGKITVKVGHQKEGAGNIAKMLGAHMVPSEGIAVRLQEHYLDSLGPQKRTVAWAKTDKKGTATFTGLDPNLSYSVLPIAAGSEFGMPKGTRKGSLKADGKGDKASYSFEENEHRIRMFTPSTLSQIKENHTLTLRTPKEFKDTVALYLVVFLSAWWLLYFVYSRRRKNSDSSFIAILMMLTGICVLTMFSINDPLEDKLVGVDMASGVIGGIVIMGILQYVDLTRLYQNKSKIGFDVPFEIISWLCKPYKRKVAYLTPVLTDRKSNVFKKLLATVGIVLCLPLIVLDFLQLPRFEKKVGSLMERLPKGSGYLVAALVLTALLWTPLGSEVGGMKVNLNIFGLKFQPSEIAKYLIIFFMAAFFTLGATKIMKYSDRGNVGLFKSKIKMLSALIVGLMILMVMYLILGDMGPGLVLALTFIILYSVIKSKIDLDKVSEKERTRKILSSDIAMLIYGVVSFLVFLIAGNSMGLMGFFCFGWFAVWIAIGLSKKQVFESAILFNLIIAAFIFGGSLMKSMPLENFNTVGERLESRNEMCTNTWGTLPLEGNDADAGENSQVAEGLWGLASGGFFGQGLGNGSPTFIPAFHTDMILESIGEQSGFIGILTVILLLAALLRKTVLTGYRAKHPFAFYFCLGIAIVTAVQFIIISLGSTGMIPLTGVTVPFLSFGKVSMIINLIAFGFVLSYTQPAVEKKEAAASASEKNIRQYNYSVSVLSLLFCGVAVVILGVFFYYQFIARDNTLIRPLFVNNSSGAPVIQYNPRIAQITNKMWAGDIYDRNGVLLATSDKSKIAGYTREYGNLDLKVDTTRTQRRYYPFGSHMAFMLGRYGSDLYALASENTGYMAEYRHLSDLRGFDNAVYDANGRPVSVNLSSENFKPGRFIKEQQGDTLRYPLRDYSALIPYLKSGYNSGRVARMNARDEHFWELGTIKPKDIYLTVDATLQTLLQQRIEEHVKEKFPTLNRVRASVVILDAQNGDLLSSANYPLASDERLKEANGETYNDMNKPASWKAYTDMDLGLVYPTPPGSTAKVLTGLAGFRKYHDAIASKTYDVASEEIIFPGEPVENNMTMKTAYRHSSNCYFINLLNDQNLFNDISQVYGSVGVSINGRKSYGLLYEEPAVDWLGMVTKPAYKSMDIYTRYKESGKKEKMTKHNSWSWAWGQNGIEATPLAMARTISAVANNGVMPKTRYLLSDTIGGVRIVDNTNLLKEYLKFTAVEHDKFNGMPWLGGKTGTPERISKTRVVKQKLRDGSTRTVTRSNGKVNDGWYICFIEGANIASRNGSVNAPLAIAIRMERINDGMSGKAVDLMKSVVLGTLKQLNYVQ